MFHKIALLGSPGSSKSTVGLSYPGVEQHVFGSNEETTAMNFGDRKDILPPVKLDWYDCLSPEDKAKMKDETVSEIDIANIIQKARAKNIIRYRRYIYSLKENIGERKTIFLDNGTPFAQDFEDYVRVVYAREFETGQGNFNSIAFAIKYKNEMTDFLRLLVSLPAHVVVSFHITMTMDEANAAKSDFMKDTAKGIKYAKEWQPMIMGQAKYMLAGIFDWVFYLWTQENPGQATKYLAKLEADDATVGIAKSRLQPFDNPREIAFPKNRAFEFFDKALQECAQSGKQQVSKAK